MLMMDNLASMNQQIEGSLSLLLWINMHTDISEKCRWPLNHLLKLNVSGAEVPGNQHPEQPCHVHIDLFCFYCSLIWRRGFDWHLLQPWIAKTIWNEPQYLEPAPGCGGTESNLFTASSRASREREGGAGRVKDALSNLNPTPQRFNTLYWTVCDLIEICEPTAFTAGSVTVHCDRWRYNWS